LTWSPSPARSPLGPGPLTAGSLRYTA
jgi:hypothetical protein